MKMRKILTLSLAAGLAVSSALAMAQGGPPQDNRGGPGQGGPGGGKGGPQQNHGPQGGPQAHGPSQQGNRGPQHGGPAPRQQARGPAPDNFDHQDWRRGGRMPDQYRGRNYVVDNYRDYHLAPPPRGYHWVGVGGDYLLVAISTGIIANIVLNGGR